jgi:TusA-related sulfurtransferase
MSVRIDPETKVGELLEAHPEAENILIGIAPRFKALRNPVLRRTVARVTTLEQAAKVGGLPVRELVLTLREALGVEGSAIEVSESEGEEARPNWVDEVEPVATIDAQELLDEGKTPVSEVSLALAGLAPGEALLVTASFHPAPLIDTLKSKGHEVYGEAGEGEEWRVWIRRG